MKEIKAIIQPHVLSQVVDALKEIEELPGITVSSVRGFGRGRARNAPNKMIEDGVEYATKTKLEVVVEDDIVEIVLATICQYGRTGRPGDGKIFVSNVEEVVNIRTDPRGEWPKLRTSRK
ncbi:MAG: P-II family nitrogen regulator [Bryobacterales bacterium]|nr:P-II family nitrogen regulator [Bryobacterales bacterium]